MPTQILEALWDESTSLCLTPQAFSNIVPASDLFNNINTQFWEYGASPKQGASELWEGGWG